MANILELLKNQAQLDVNAMELVELTNSQINHVNVPLFVFSAEEAVLNKKLPKDYRWEDPQAFRDIIKDYAIEGVPFF